MSTRFLDQRWPWLLAAAALILLGLVSMYDLRDWHLGPSDPRPTGSLEDLASLGDRSDTNLLFILVDTLRADRLGAYGYERDTSPTLDRLAREGVRFSRQLAQSSWTKASMASMWTGLYPQRAGITRFDQVVPEEARLPAEILREGGLRTAGIYRNGWVAPTFGFEQGFEVYIRPVAKGLPAKLRAQNPTLAERGTDEDVMSAALEFLRVHGEERWFLYLHLMDLHEYLYDAESAVFGGQYSDMYDNSILWTDTTLEILLRYLDEWGFRENTIIAIASDHGEAFRERGFEGHAREVYRETTEVPFILSLPFKLEGGIVVDSRSRNVDVWPTLLELMGFAAESGIDGESLVPDILAAGRGEAVPDDRVAISHLDQTWGQTQAAPRITVAVAEGPRRYVRSSQPGGVAEELFDASEDPGELDERSSREPEAVSRLGVVADEYLDAKPHWGEAPRREIGELELNQLRALGYAIP